MTDWRFFAVLILATGTPAAFAQLAAQAASQVSTSAAADAARNAAANSESRKSDQMLSKDDEFADALRIQVIGDGVGVPPDFSRGGRVTIYGPASPPGDREPTANQTADSRRAPPAPGCYGPNAEGEQCGQGQIAGDPVATRIKLGTQRNIEVAPPTNIQLHKSGVALPACTEDSREGLACQ
jgi:hypothetical protein